jgi:cell wall-associated NlpC family hydrolase
VKTVVKRALVAPLITAAAVLPAVVAHPSAANAAVSSSSVATGFAVVDHTAAGVAGAAGQEAGTVSQAANTHHRSRHSRRYWAYAWARHQWGAPYCWGGTGGCFDCSGLVSAAYGHVHMYFGRSTFSMLASGRLVRVSSRSARRGDLAFFGSGHVELVTGPHYTFGALHSGAPVGLHRITRWWHPTAYFHVLGAH